MMTMSPTIHTTEEDNGEQESDYCTVLATTTVASVMITISLLIIVVLILIWYRKRRTALINLTKHHKESDENSYTSSKHSHESGSKSPDPEYDVIKINPSTDKLKVHSVKSKSAISCQVYSSVQSNVLKHEEDWDCGPMYSSVDTNAGSPHKIGDFNVNSTLYTDIESHKTSIDDITDNISSVNGQSNATDVEDNSAQPHIYAEVDVKTKKVNQEHKNTISKESTAERDEDLYSDEVSTPPPVPPQTTEMLYLSIQKGSDTDKVN